MSIYQSFIGIDVSKAHLDLAVFRDGKIRKQFRIKNSIEAVTESLSTDFEGIDLSKSLFCMEATGIYCRFLLAVLCQENLDVWVEDPTQIKFSAGFHRGKDDRSDSQRIAEYAARNADAARLYRPEKEVLKQIELLHVLQKRLKTVLQILRVPQNEVNAFYKPEEAAFSSEITQGLCNKIKEDINRISLKISTLIASDEELKHQHHLLLSVRGVGPVTASEILTATKGFTKFTDPKKFACHAGVAPFEQSSGQVSGRRRLSRRANKRLKCLLHLCAVAAIRHPGEMRDYFDRKVAEGKHKMLIINNIRNKIVLRMFACIRNNEAYRPDYRSPLAV